MGAMETPLIEFKDVSKSFGDRTILDTHVSHDSE